MRVGVAILSLCGGCGDVAPLMTDAADDADPRPPCNPATSFGKPMPVAELNTPDLDVVTDVSADELTIYISSNHNVAGAQLFYAKRSSRADTFGPRVPIYSPAPAFDNFSMAVTSDGLSAIVSSNRNATDENLFAVTRPNLLTAFDAGAAVTQLNTTTTDATPRFSRDNATLYFDSARAGSRDLYRASVGASGFGAPAPISELNSSALDVAAVLSADELTIYFASTRPPSTDGDIYTATRASRSAAFSAPTPLISVNSLQFDGPGAISIDGCTLYLSSSRDGDMNIFVARK